MKTSRKKKTSSG